MFYIMMSEIQGNQYFLARNLTNAAKNLQYALVFDPLNKPVRKKLVICYLQIGETQKALNTFYNLIIEDIVCIINTDSVSDDCPCPELVTHYGTILPYQENSTDLKIMLDMLWLSCDVQKSMSFFHSLIDENIENEKISSIVKINDSRLKTKQQNIIN
jgi:hypothetical protein